MQLEPTIITGGDCAAAVITPDGQDFIHTYYDVCPWSPSGRYLLALRAPFTDRRNGPDDVAEVCVFDLQTLTVQTVWRTTAWGIQTGAHAQWGASDRRIYFNDRRDGQAVGVRLDLQTGQAQFLPGLIWLVDPAETYALSPCQIRTNLTQFGYGISVLPAQQLTNSAPAAADDGFYRTDLATGKRSLLVSLAAIRDAVPDKQDLDERTLYAFHCKLNPQGTRLLLVVRAVHRHQRYRPMLLSCRPDGSDLRCVLTSRQWLAGQSSNHPTWTPDGQRILMNHTGEQPQRRFCLIDPVSGQAKPVSHRFEGTGHPTINPVDGRWLLTDDSSTRGDRKPSTIRRVDLVQDVCRDLLTVDNPAREDEPLRCDAHPVWDRTGRLICLQATPGRHRQLIIAEPARPAGQMPQITTGVA